MSQDLQAVLAQIMAPESGRDGEKRYRVRQIAGTRHYIGKDSNATPCLLLDSADQTIRPSIRLAALEVDFSLHCKITEPGAQDSTMNLTVIACNSRDRALVEYFAHAVHVIVNILGPRPRSLEIAEAVRRLTELFQNLSKTTGKSVLGLFGELFAIHISRSPQAALCAWRSAVDNRFDFSIDDVRLEAKASSDRTRAHHFSREQCLPPEGTVGVLISLFVERAGGGLSVADLIQRLEDQMRGNPNLILRLHATVAETLGDATTGAMSMRFDEHLARSSVRIYELSRIPAIRGDIPPEVSQVRFRSDIGGLAPAIVPQLVSQSARLRDLLPVDA